MSSTECPGCNTEYANSGIRSHMQSCVGLQNVPGRIISNAELHELEHIDPSDYGDEPGGSDEGDEGASDEEPGDSDTDGEDLESRIKCPNCDNVDNGSKPHIYNTGEKLEKVLQKKGIWDEEHSRLNTENDFMCGNCGAYLKQT